MNETLTLSISQNFLDKANVAPKLYFCKRHQTNDACWAYAAFDNATMTPTQVALHVTEGKAICVAALKRDPEHKARRTELYNFASAQVIGIDFDAGPGVTELIAHDFIRQHAFLVYPTASSQPDAPRSRALFRLSAPVIDLMTYREYVARVLRVFSVEQADELQDGVRIFYGSTQLGAEIFPTRVLPLAVLNALPATPEPPKRERVASSYVADDFDRQRVIDALGCIPAETIPYRDWITVLAALNSEFGSDARSIAEQWTDYCSEVGEVEMRLKTFDRGSTHPAGAGSIVYLAKQYGYQAPVRTSFPVSMSTGMTRSIPDIRLAQQPAVQDALQPIITWHTSDDSMARYKERLHTAQPTKFLPLPFPFETLKEAGGFCWAIPPGIMLGIVGISGGAKTSFAETLIERWRQLGSNHVLWWGPEWSWERMADRTGQRFGGPRADEMMLHEMALSERDNHVPDAERFGRMLSAQMVTKADKIADLVISWPGKNLYIDQMDVEIDVLLLAAERKLAEQAALAQPVRIAVFDYLQLMNMRSVRTEADRITQVLGRLKAFCVDQHLIGVVVSQVTKQNAGGVKDGTETLDAESGQFQRSDKFNLVITLNPVYEDGKIVGRGVLKVAKNSLGKTLEKTVPLDMTRLTWVDKAL